MCLAAGKPGEGKLELTIVDEATKQPVPCRVHLKNQAGVPRKVYALPFWFDHFNCPGRAELTLARGNYTFTVERGPEYAESSGHFRIEDFADDRKTVPLRRAVDMKAEGWWSGDLHVRRPQRDLALAMPGDDLHVAPVVTWHNKKNEYGSGQLPSPRLVSLDGDRYCDLLAGCDARVGGTLLFFGLAAPLEIVDARPDVPSSVTLLRQARQQPGVWIDAANPASWDLPLWLAGGLVDSIQIANEQLQRGGMKKLEPPGKPRDKSKGDEPRDRAQWWQRIYFNVLEAGLRLPPSAGSGSGVEPNPLGYNRVYVALDGEKLDYDAWWQGFRQGRVVVTNGPLIRPLANGEKPGHVFRIYPGEPLELDVMMNLTTRDSVRYVELIVNGAVAQTLPLAEWGKTGHFRPQTFTEGGWCLVRVVAEVDKTYRFAMSAPWYVEVGGGKPRVSRRAAQFFLDWVDERAGRMALPEGPDRSVLEAQIAEARAFWQGRLAAANVD